MLQRRLRASENQVNHTVRAKYYRTIDGVTKLAKVQQLSFPSFRVPGFELVEDSPSELDKLFDEAEESIDERVSESEDKDERNVWRALQRAKITAFDKILCNPDLDTFATFTISPGAVTDRKDYDEVYKTIRKWLENRVQRKGLKYVLCPERHKAGGLHFHSIMNSVALKLIPAVNAHTGEPIYHNRHPLYNVADWSYGFTSAELIESSTLDREKVAKYIFKYMGKQGTEGKIGGRYVLSGGNLKTPIYLYGEDPREFIPILEDEARESGFYRESDHEGIKYREWSFI